MWPSNIMYFVRILFLLYLPLQHALPSPAPPPICSKHHSPDVTGGYSIETQPGDATVSLLTNERIPLHEINLNALNDILATAEASTNVTFGLRILYVPQADFESGNADALHALLLLEVEYLQQCTASPIAILVLHELWPQVATIADDIEYNIWQLPAASRLLFPKIAHMLYDLPWNVASGFVGPKTFTVHASDDVDSEDAFVNAARDEQMCLNAGHSAKSANDANMPIVALGKDAFLTAGHQLDVVTDARLMVAVPIVMDDYRYIANLTAGAYVITEAAHSARVTLVLSITAVLSQLAKLLHQSLQDCSITPNATNNTTASHHDDPDDLHDAMSFLTADSFQSCKHPDNWNLDCISGLTARDMYAELVGSTLNIEPTVVLNRLISNGSPPLAGIPQHDLRHIAAIDVLTNVTTFYNYSDQPLVPRAEPIEPTLGSHFQCDNASAARDAAIDIYNVYDTASPYDLYWRIRPEIWVAIGLTLAVLGILISFAIFVFVLARLYMEDVLEGNPVGTIALLIALIMLFASFIPFALEYTSDRHIVEAAAMAPPPTPIGLCAVRLVLVMLGYCFPFALLLCRAIMLASIGGDGGFLSHVNGYIQSVICAFSVLVQVGMSVQLVVLVVGHRDTMSCDAFYYGAWFWVLLAYDGFLLGLMLLLAPFCVHSQRNYREGVLILVGSVLCVAVWSVWIPLATFGSEWRDAAVPLGMQATGWTILGAILIPRSFLIVRGIARSDIAQALPSLASLAFAHNSQCMSEQSIYECVNPAMRQQMLQNGTNSVDAHGGVAISHQHQIELEEDEYGAYEYSEHCQSPSEIPTLPLRGASRKQRNMLEYASSQQSTLPASPNKATRF